MKPLHPVVALLLLRRTLVETGSTNITVALRSSTIVVIIRKNRKREGTIPQTCPEGVSATTGRNRVLNTARTRRAGNGCGSLVSGEKGVNSLRDRGNSD